MQEMQEMQVQSLGWEDPLEEEMATYSSILAWRIPMDRGAWWAAVHGVAKSQTRLKQLNIYVPSSLGENRNLRKPNTSSKQAQKRGGASYPPLHGLPPSDSVFSVRDRVSRIRIYHCSSHKSRKWNKGLKEDRRVSQKSNVFFWPHGPQMKGDSYLFQKYIMMGKRDMIAPWKMLRSSWPSEMAARIVSFWASEMFTYP